MIVVAVKCFRGSSALHDVHAALGQQVAYRDLPAATGPPFQVYLSQRMSLFPDVLNRLVNDRTELLKSLQFRFKHRNQRLPCTSKLYVERLYCVVRLQSIARPTLNLAAAPFKEELGKIVAAQTMSLLACLYMKHK